MKPREIHLIRVTFADMRELFIQPPAKTMASFIACFNDGVESFRCNVGATDAPKSEISVNVVAKEINDAKRLAEAFAWINDEVNNLINAEADMSLQDMIALAATRHTRSDY